jgi:hypothetical protein
MVSDMKFRLTIWLLSFACAVSLLSACAGGVEAGSISSRTTPSTPVTSTTPSSSAAPAVSSSPVSRTPAPVIPYHNWPDVKYDGQGPCDIFLIYAESYPNNMTVPVGTRVTWYNMDVHWYGLSSNDGLFYTALDPEGGNFSFTFDSPGTYWYDIDPYPNMNGCVVVV